MFYDRALGVGVEMGDTGYKLLKKTCDFSFMKWGEYMKRANLAERKVKKLKSLLLLVDPAVSDIEMNTVAAKQWEAFVNEFPDELNPPTEKERLLK